ncbi:MAG: 4-hydroxy-3-methylbut-2-enyl diphosphate reductase [Actinobacteria bacterium]|nr:MAG: 4-hydroxy-3-methylbut-2-enyl diphosphate reductase [Actinomycetota bacterium]
MKVEIAKHAGYCYGVERALDLTSQAGKSPDKLIYTLGPIIHNPQVVNRLETNGIHHIDSIDEIDKGTVIIRTHGVEPQVVRKAKAKGLKVVDATCPFVKKAQQCASTLLKEGYDLIIVGERNHPEVVGLLAYAGLNAIVVERPEDLAKLPKEMNKVGVVVQTTQSQENLDAIISGLLATYKQIKVFNTICSATTKRQSAARQLAKKADVMLIVGGKNSANTTRLTQICLEMNPKSYHIETASEIKKSWFNKDDLVGVTAGASTADWILQEVVDSVCSIK